MTPERRAFHNAKGRCNCPSATGYENYGKRGIKFLFNSFEEFYNHLGQKPTSKHTLDRINNEGHYEPGNVRWATRSQQNKNTRPISEQGRKHMSEGAKARCTINWRKEVSERAKRQHVNGNLGQQTWSQESKQTARKNASRSLKGKPGARKGKKASPEQRERYRQAAIRREAQKRANYIPRKKEEL